MNCKECGHELPEGSLFCNHCGAKIIVNLEENKEAVVETSVDNSAVNQNESLVDATSSENVDDQNKVAQGDGSDKVSISKKSLYIGLAAALLIVCCVGFFVARSMRHADSSNTGSAKQAKTVDNNADKKQLE